MQPLVHMIRPHERDFVAQLEYVANYAALRMERSAEIITELSDILSFLGSVGFLHPDRMRRTFELLSLVLHATGIIEMRVKHALACRRPNEYSPQIQPMILTPGHGSLPSGHATESFAVAFVFYALICQVRRQSIGVHKTDPIFIQLMRIAERIAINRTVAGVHFPVDSVAGMVLGRALAEFYIARFSGLGRPVAACFDGRNFKGDFSYENVLAMSYRKHTDEGARSRPEGDDKNVTCGSALSIPRSDLLHRLWSEAVAECKLIVTIQPKRKS
jgi:membrane-associated phospholipid phosphatase